MMQRSLFKQMIVS